MLKTASVINVFLYLLIEGKEFDPFSAAQLGSIYREIIFLSEPLSS